MKFSVKWPTTGHFSVADPGFPVGGCGPCSGGALTPEAVTFHKFGMAKQKNLNPWGRALGTPPRSANVFDA